MFFRYNSLKEIAPTEDLGAELRCISIRTSILAEEFLLIRVEEKV